MRSVSLSGVLRGFFLVTCIGRAWVSNPFARAHTNTNRPRFEHPDPIFVKQDFAMDVIIMYGYCAGLCITVAGIAHRRSQILQRS